MNRRLLLKYSDVFEVPRDPRNYFAMLLRCGGDIPLNICAMVTGLSSSGVAMSAAVQSSLEYELFSGSAKNRIRRLRGAENSGRPFVAFTRASALLNLKVLLAMDREELPYSVTAVGAIALHANDYVDIELSEADPFLLMTQLLPLWEGAYNPRDVGNLLRRYRYIFCELVLGDANISKLLRDEFGMASNEIRIDGLMIDDYFGILFAAYTVAGNGNKDHRTSFIDLADVMVKSGATSEEQEAFLASRTADEHWFRETLGPIETESDLSSRVSASAWATDFDVFRRRPLLKMTDGRFIVLDLQYLIENAASGLFWNLVSALSSAGREALHRYWGKVFEQYAQRVIRSYFHENRAEFNVKIGELEIDALINDGDGCVIVVEFKRGTIPQAVKTSRDAVSVRRLIEKKFVANDRGKAKGVAQLARSSKAVLAPGNLDGRPIARVIPVLVVEDAALGTAGANHFLGNRLIEIAPDSRINSLILATIDELEEIAPYVAAGDISWTELSDARQTPRGIDVRPLHDTFTDLVVRKNLKTRRNPLLEKAGAELADLIASKFTHLAAQSESAT